MLRTQKFQSLHKNFDHRGFSSSRTCRSHWCPAECGVGMGRFGMCFWQGLHDSVMRLCQESLGIIKNCSAGWKKLDSITSNCSILLFQLLIKHKNCIFNISSILAKHLEKTSQSQATESQKKSSRKSSGTEIKTFPLGLLPGKSGVCSETSHSAQAIY